MLVALPDPVFDTVIVRRAAALLPDRDAAERE